MKKFTNLIIVDASSSMRSKEAEVRDGLKDLLTDIRKDIKKSKDMKTRTIVCQFSSANNFKVLLDTKKRKKIKESIADGYKPSGMTALYDAIGQGFSLVGKKQTGVFVNILTDGDENASQEYTHESVKKLIEEAKEKKWGLTFMGTTEDAIQNAVAMGVTIGNTFQFSNNRQGVNTSNLKKKMSRDKYYTSVVASASLDEIDNLNLMEDDAVSGIVVDISKKTSDTTTDNK